ncbi:UTP--glucose-1-phosphate uridylyltransferase, partial [Nocardioides albidus]|uniref:UTP--glucose-1-phosphate uridylyltransferase n=1 Tax=Nocardioides albidus TaxID=1517589 RepID=UPI001EFF6585
SDVYEIGADFALTQVATDVPYVDLDPEHYRVVGEFDKRFPEGAPSLAKATALKVEGDWTFGHGVQVVGSVELDGKGAHRVPEGEILSGTDD